MASEMIIINSMNSFIVGGYTVKTHYTIRQYYEFTDVFVVREEEDSGTGHLFAYGYVKNDLKMMWKFPYDGVIGIRKIIPELQKKEDFITLEHYQEYINCYKGKELLEVYVASWPYDLRYIVNANTGEIYNKMESR